MSRLSLRIGVPTQNFLPQILIPSIENFGLVFLVILVNSARRESAIISFSKGIIPDLRWNVHIFVKRSDPHGFLFQFSLVVDVALVYNTGPLRHGLLELQLITRLHSLESSRATSSETWRWSRIFQHQIARFSFLDGKEVRFITHLARSIRLLLQVTFDSTRLFEISHHLLLGHYIAHPLCNILFNGRFVLLLVISTIFDVVLADKVLFDLFLVVRPIANILIKMVQSSLLLGFFKLQWQREVFLQGRLSDWFYAEAMIPLSLLRIDSWPLFHKINRHDVSVDILILMQCILVWKQVCFGFVMCSHAGKIPTLTFRHIAFVFISEAEFAGI